MILVGLIFAAKTGLSLAQAVTQGFGADTVLQRGAIVRLKDSDHTKVENLSINNAETMYGVVVDPNDAPVTLSEEGQKVFVATTGKYEVLVSAQNGPIKSGDYITISSINGVGMKANNKQSIVVGRAFADFDGANDSIASAKFNDNGTERVMAIGRIMADVTVMKNPLLVTETSLPGFLRKVAETTAGKPVDSGRVYLGLLVFLASAVIAGNLIYGGVRSSIISIGRNPLSKRSIVRSMAQVVLTGLIIFVSGIFGVYLLLKL